MSDAAPAPAPGQPSAWRDLLWLALAFGALNFFLLGRLPLANPDEPRYAQIPREMLAADDWVLGRLNGIPYLEKPPLVYWTVGLCHRVFGPGEWSMRLTPALFGLAGVLLAYATTRRLHGRRAGLAAAVVLGTTLMTMAHARLLLLDMALATLMSATLFCFILGVREPAGPRRRWLFLGLYASAALATLTKGLIGFLIPGAVMFLWLLIFNQWRRLLPMHLVGGGALFLAIAAPWHVLAAQRFPGWVEFYFVNEHWRRFTEPGHGRTEPWFFFTAVLLAGLFPWVGFLGGAVREAIAGGPFDGLRASWARRKENADAWFFVTWAAFIFLFFSKSQSKLIPYLLPMFPPLAVLIGAWLARRWEQREPRRLRVGLGIFAFGCGLLAAALLVLALKPDAIKDVAQAAALRPYALALAAVLLAGGVLAPWLARVRGVAAGLGAVAGTAAVFFLGAVVAGPEFQRPDTKSLALLARERMQPQDRVYHFWAFFHDWVYYTGRPAGLVSYTDEMQVQFLDPAERAARFIDDAELRRQWAGPGRVWVVLRKRDLGHFRQHVTAAYQLIAEGRGHYLFSNQP
jgi:4-amino-4-deoxy-L-arabinose transferase-like glycosyltransferase